MAAIVQGIPKPLLKWITNLRFCRDVSATLKNVLISGEVKERSPQGGITSTTLWVLVDNRLLKFLNMDGVYAQTYADDFLIMTNCISIEAAVDRLQLSLKKVENWCI